MTEFIPLGPVKRYKGEVDGTVWVEGYRNNRRTLHPLRPRLDLRNHSPTGFNWGYGGSGPAQLALALCADALGDDAMALAVYQRFKFKIVGRLPRNETWVLSAEEISAVARALATEGEVKPCE